MPKAPTKPRVAALDDGTDDDENDPLDQTDDSRIARARRLPDLDEPADGETEPESLGTFGLARHPGDLAALSKPPIPFQIAGYTIEPDDQGEHAEHLFTFHVRPDQEFGPLFRLLVRSDNQGDVPVPEAMKFIASCLVPHEKNLFIDTLSRDDMHFRAEAVQEIAQALTKRYTGRPTLPRSARRAGARHNGRTTAGGR
jgi:hypothetical protein